MALTVIELAVTICSFNTIEIPSALGYGEAGRAPIPGNAALEFEVWVKQIERGAATP